MLAFLAQTSRPEGFHYHDTTLPALEKPSPLKG